jgi:hypothetical protein
MLILGSCHCRNVTFRLRWTTPAPETIPARACGCTFCVKHGGVWTSCPGGTLVVAVRDPARVSTYAFGTHTADFHVCARCGAVPLVTSTIDGRTYAVVNVNTFDNVERSRLQPVPVSFDEEDEAVRLARRARGWIADVTFHAPAPP